MMTQVVMSKMTYAGRMTQDDDVSNDVGRTQDSPTKIGLKSDEKCCG
jgi:hypothetical protein